MSYKFSPFRALLNGTLSVDNFLHTKDYDYAAAFNDPSLQTESKDDGLHFSDRYKMPNHPTFSQDAIGGLLGPYAALAGKWWPGVTDNSAYYTPSIQGFAQGKRPVSERW